jgi:hypothetical protein
MNRTRNSVYSKLLLLILLAASQIPGIANAQTTNLRGKFHVRNEVHWGGAVLSAGNYSLTIEEAKDSTLFAVVRSEDGKQTAVAMVTGSGKAETGGRYLFITNDGTRRVRLLNLPDENISLSFGPLRKQDREQMHTAGNEIVQVTTARR